MAGPDAEPPDPGRRRPLMCPSSEPGPQSVVFAVRGPADEHGATIRYLDRLVPTSAEVLALADPVDPREVFRFGAPCVERACGHFDGQVCGLGGQVATEFAPVTAGLPRCHLRGRCRWFAERGADACTRCPVVVTLRTAPDEQYAHVVAVRADAPPPAAGTS